MLVLARKPGTSIVIGGFIKVTVIQIKGANIMLGIEAPREVTIDREEIHEIRKRERGAE